MNGKEYPPLFLLRVFLLQVLQPNEGSRYHCVGTNRDNMASDASFPPRYTGNAPIALHDTDHPSACSKLYQALESPSFFLQMSYARRRIEVECHNYYF